MDHQLENCSRVDKNEKVERKYRKLRFLYKQTCSRVKGDRRPPSLLPLRCAETAHLPPTTVERRSRRIGQKLNLTILILCVSVHNRSQKSEEWKSVKRRSKNTKGRHTEHKSKQVGAQLETHKNRKKKTSHTSDGQLDPPPQQKTQW